MADRLTAQQLIDFTASTAGQRMRKKVTRTATINNDAISLTDITEYVKEWGAIKFEIYNKHPDERGKLRFPLLDIVVDNSTNYFDRGGALFPNGSSDFASTSINVTVEISGTTFLYFKGIIREPEYGDSKILTIVAEHPLSILSDRKWRRGDRIGGDTGINQNFT